MDVVDLEQAKDVKRFGGKASNLSQLLAAGLPVPGGLAVAVSAFTTDGSLRAGAQEDITNWLSDQPKNQLYAVRSSALAEDGAEASWAGQFETFLDVPVAEILEKIVACHTGILARAQAYGAAHAQAGIAVAVVVQRMLAPDYAGVLFTKNPIDGSDHMLGEYVEGTGEKLVSGQVTPESFAWDPRTQTFDQDTALIPFPVSELIELAERVVSLYDAIPQDIEWAVQDGTVYLLQARPITTLG